MPEPLSTAPVQLMTNPLTVTLLYSNMLGKDGAVMSCVVTLSVVLAAERLPATSSARTVNEYAAYSFSPLIANVVSLVLPSSVAPRYT